MRKKLVRTKNNTWKQKWEIEPYDTLCAGIILCVVAFMVYLLLQILRG